MGKNKLFPNKLSRKTYFLIKIKEFIMEKLFFILCFCILFIVSCSKKPPIAENRTTLYIEEYITSLKEIEIPPTAKFNTFLSAMEDMNSTVENSNEPLGDSLLLEFRDVITETIKVNRVASEEFRALAMKDKPDYVEDTIYILLRAATAILGQSYEMRREAMTSFYRYFSLGTMRFFNEYSEKMSRAMENSRQAFFFLTLARVRQKVMTGDTLNASFQEFLNIPELPEYEEPAVLSDSADIIDVSYEAGDGDLLPYGMPHDGTSPDSEDVIEGSAEDRRIKRGQIITDTE